MTDFTRNEVRTLVALLEAVAGGAVTLNQAATARGLAARFRDRQTPERGDQVIESGDVIGTPAAPPRIDPAAIFTKRRAQVRQAQAASAAARGN